MGKARLILSHGAPIDQLSILAYLIYGNSLHSYLSDVVHVDIWWYAGSQLKDAPASLPRLSSPLNGSSIVPYRYDLNTGAL